MIPEYVIVTLQTESGASLGDFQLPTAVPIEKLALLLKDSLTKQITWKLGNWENMELCRKGFPLEKEKTLADHGIWDGSILTVREARQ